MFELSAPDSEASLSSALDQLHSDIGSFMAALPGDEFETPQGEFWSPSEHLRHLIRSVKAVIGGLRVPKLMLALRFGFSLRGSRSFAEVKEVYRQALAAGAKARGRYLPSEPSADYDSAAAARRSALERWDEAGRGLVAALAGWSDSALDRYRLPHPLLGKMTVREILFFTFYHNAHHARRVAERRAGDAAPTGGVASGSDDATTVLETGDGRTNR